MIGWKLMKTADNADFADERFVQRTLRDFIRVIRVIRG